MERTYSFGPEGIPRDLSPDCCHISGNFERFRLLHGRKQGRDDARRPLMGQTSSSEPGPETPNGANLLIRMRSRDPQGVEPAHPDEVPRPPRGRTCSSGPGPETPKGSNLLIRMRSRDPQGVEHAHPDQVPRPPRGRTCSSGCCSMDGSAYALRATARSSLFKIQSPSLPITHAYEVGDGGHVKVSNQLSRRHRQRTPQPNIL